MKSRLIVALAMAMSLMTVNAAAQNVTPNDLVGKWTTSEHEADDAGEIDMTATSTPTFNADGTFSDGGYCLLKIKLDEETNFSCDFTVTAKGTYTVSNGVLTLEYNPKTVEVKEGKIEMPGILKTMLLKPVMNEMKKEMKKTQQFRINSVSDTELKMISITEKDATEDVYTRVK